MWKRVVYYCELARLDLWRFKSASCLQALIVAGVCFPVLILLALKRGHVEDLRRELVMSPTGRLVKIYPASAGRPFTRAELGPLAKELGNVDIAIPNVRRVVEISTVTSDEIHVSTDVYATCPGDPILKAQHVDVLKEGELAIVLNEVVATALKASLGDTVKASIVRATDNQKGSIDLIVKGIFPASSKDNVAFVDSIVIDRISFFQRNGAVPDWNWPGLATEPTERYPCFLLVNDAGDPLRPVDMEVLNGQGFKVDRVTDESIASLGGAIPVENRDKVVVYRLTRSGSETNVGSRMADKWAEIGSRTLATDAVIPWCATRKATLANGEVELVGLTFPPRCQWLNDLLISPSLPFDRGADYRQCRRASEAQAEPSTVTVSIDGKVTLPIRMATAQMAGTSPSANDDEIADATKPANRVAEPKPGQNEKVFVPARMLAYLDEYFANSATYEAQSQRITGVVAIPTYEDALIFAATIDDVPEIVAKAVAQGFPYNSENARIQEIQRQDGSLQKLVLIVGVLVFSFGVFTVFGVLWESTARKRSTIGIMRVMGVTPLGAFLMVVLRALMLGALAGCLTVVAGWMSVTLLSWQPPAGSPYVESKPVISAVINQADVIVVVIGSVACCAIGSFVPGLSAGRLDPFDALVQGRFR